MNSGEGKSAGSNEDGGLGAELLAAAREGGRGDEILRMLEADPTLIHVTDPVGDTTLHVLGRAGNLEVAEKVVAWVKMNGLTKVLLEQNLQGDTPLHVAEAAAKGHKQVARLFLEAKFAAQFVKNKAGVSPHELAREAGFNFSQSSRGTVRSVCVLNADLDMARARGDLGLCHSSSDDDDEDQEFEDELYYHFYGAVRDDREDLVLKAFKKAARRVIRLAPTAANQANKKAGVSPLYLAVKKGHLDLVKCMLQAMPLTAISPSARKRLLARKNPSLVNAAIRARNLGILEALMEELPELINLLDYKGWRVLSYAAYKGYLDGVCYLLKKFPDCIEKYDRDGSLPIHKAAGGGHVSIVKEFLQYCPDMLYAVSKNGQSILHFAVKYTKADVLSYLTKEVTEVEKIFRLKDDEGKTFIDLANELKR